MIRGGESKINFFFLVIGPPNIFLGKAFLIFFLQRGLSRFFFPAEGLSKKNFLREAFLIFFPWGWLWNLFPLSNPIKKCLNFFFSRQKTLIFFPGEDPCKFIFSWKKAILIFFFLDIRPFQVFFFLEEALLIFFPGEGPQNFFYRFPLPPRSLIVIP